MSLGSAVLNQPGFYLVFQLCQQIYAILELYQKAFGLWYSTARQDY
jgi:hypothetical protein